jgi:hypothetical protein
MFLSLTETCSRLYWNFKETLPLESGKDAFLESLDRFIEEKVLPEILAR